MGFLTVILAALGAFAAGAAYYGALSKPWMEASGVPTGPDGKPQNSSSPAPYLVSFVCIILVTGMMRHVFALSGIDTVGKGLVSGLGIGAFFISPWMFLNAAYEMRGYTLPAINAGYAIIGCGVAGLLLVLLGGWF